MTGTADGETDISKLEIASHETLNPDESKWMVDFGVQPRYNANNYEYVYTVTEEASSGDTLQNRGYTREAVGEVNDDNRFSITAGDKTTVECSVEDTGNIPVKTLHFKNVYTPITKNLIVNKIWVGDENCTNAPRPENVELTLYCKYNEYDDLASVSFLNQSNYLGLNPEQYQVTIPKNAEQTVTFTGLPIRVNPTGTAVSNGQSYPISYYVKETEPTLAQGKVNPYTYGVDYTHDNQTILSHKKDDNDSNNSTLANMTVSAPTAYIVNELKKRRFEITKSWVDNNVSTDTASNLHYAIDVTLQNASVGYNQTRTINDFSQPAIFEDVPYYSADGTELSYEVTEKVHSENISDTNTTLQKYHYNFSVGEPTKMPQLVTYRITNTLDVVNLVVTKKWEDKFGNDDYKILRPVSLPENLNLTLQRRLKDNSADPWKDVNSPAPTITKDNTARTWTYTYRNLLRYNENNQEYIYRVVENLTVPTYTKSEGESTWNATANEWEQTITNTLKTRDVTITKVWENDAGFEENRYPVHVTMTGTITGENSIQYQNKEIPVPATGEDSNSITIQNVPVYNKDGNVISYTVEELEKSVNDTGYQTSKSKHKYGYHLTSNVPSYDKTNYPDLNVVSGYTLTNTLPLTSVKVTKVWENFDSNSMYPQSSVVVKLYQNRRDTSETRDTSEIKELKANTWTDTFDRLLQYDENNVPYEYTVSEIAVDGFTTKYTGNGTSDVTITNTPLLGNATFVKKDASYENRLGRCQNNAGC